MPICTTCAQSVPYLYTIYQSAHNLRLEPCFADPYVEHDEYTLLLDLILLKRGVFRHLLFNKGYEPRRAKINTDEGQSPDTANVLPTGHIQSRREKERWRIIAKLGLGTILVDAFIRWSHLNLSDAREGENQTWSKDRLVPFFLMLAGCAVETIAFHVGVTMACAFTLKISGPLLSSRRRSKNNEATPPNSSIMNEFRLSHVPLTLLYSSLTKLFLLLLLSIWKPTTEAQLFSHQSSGNDTIYDWWLFRNSLQLLDEDKLDREWVVRNVLGGMSAGFGLRVVLDIHPVFTTLVVLFGWGVKTAVANFVHPWVNTREQIGDAFLAYSIP